MKTRQSWVASASMLETPAAVRPFVVVNPLARRASSAVAEVVGQCYRMGIDAPRSLATTREETGSQQARQAVEAGADVATCPLAAIKGLLRHPLTDSGLAAFLADHKRVNG